MLTALQLAAQKIQAVKQGGSSVLWKPPVVGPTKKQVTHDAEVESPEAPARVALAGLTADSRAAPRAAPRVVGKTPPYDPHDENPYGVATAPDKPSSVRDHVQYDALAAAARVDDAAEDDDDDEDGPPSASTSPDGSPSSASNLKQQKKLLKEKKKQLKAEEKALLKAEKERKKQEKKAGKKKDVAEVSAGKI